MTDDGSSTTNRIARRWPAVRAKGMAHFVLMRGLLMWGGLMFVFFTAMTWVKFGPQHPRFVLLLVVSAGLCAIGGLLWGVLTWAISERIYRSLPSSKDAI